MSTNTKNSNKENPKDSKEQAINKAEEQKQKLNNFLLDMIDQQKINIKHANLMGQKRIAYVKGREFVQFFKENFQTIKDELLQINKNFNLGTEATDNSIQVLYNILFSQKLILKLNKFEGDKAKYPKQLLLPKKGEDIFNFEESKFYWINTESNPSTKGFIILLILIMIVLMVCLFPVWPLKMKIGVLWCLFVLLVSLLVFLILIIVVAFVGIIFGYDIIVMPNLGEPKMKWWDRCFNPFVGYYKRDDDWCVFIIRILLALLIIAIAGIFIFNPALFQTLYDYTIGACKKLYNYVLEKFILAPERRKNELRKQGSGHYNFEDF